MAVVEQAPGTISVAIATNALYARHATITLFSLCQNNPAESMNLYVLCAGLDAASRRNIEESLSEFDHARVSFIDVDDSLLHGLETGFQGRRDRTNYFRLLLPQLLGEVTDKIVYLDSDVVVVGEIRSLWDQVIDEYYFAAVENPWHRLAGRHSRVGLEADAPYFNSGLMLLNLKKMQNVDQVRRIARIKADEQLRLMRGSDMDLLNAMFKTGWLKLEPKWNVNNTHLFLVEFYMESRMESAEYLFTDSPRAICAAVANPSIIHFTGLPKPWESSCAHPLKGLYWLYHEQTRWRGTPMLKGHSLISLRERLIRLFIGIQRLIPLRIKNWMVAKAYREPGAR